ncbi:MAG: hypothetical protein R3C99_03880 [Pirellulaceae bacterium]
MNRVTIGAIALLAFLGAHEAWGQAVQLPTYSQFGVQTSALVPDGGAAYLGGVRRSAIGSVSRGLPGGGPLFKNRAIGRSDSATGVSVHATIIDLRELDEAVLAEAAARRQAREAVVASFDEADSRAVSNMAYSRAPSVFSGAQRDPVRLTADEAAQAARLSRFMGRR